MVYPQCQLGWIWSHLGDTQLAAALRIFPRSFHEKRKPQAECGQHHPRGWSPRLKKKRNQGSQLSTECFPTAPQVPMWCELIPVPGLPHPRERVLPGEYLPWATITLPNSTCLIMHFVIATRDATSSWCTARPFCSSPLPPFLLGEPHASLLNGL